MWAHIMWQKYHIRVDEWLSFSEEERIFYMASEDAASDYPLSSIDRLAKARLVTSN